MGKRIVYGRGYAVLGSALPAVTRDLTALQRTCDRGTISADQCYAALTSIGLDYGPALRAIDVLHLGQDQVLARLCLPPSVADTVDRFVLHPSLMDGAIQATIGLYLGDHDSSFTIPSRPALPFAVKHVAVFGPCTPTMWAYIRPAGGGAEEGAHDGLMHALDIDLCDEHGLVRVRLTGLACRAVDGAGEGAAISAGSQAVPTAANQTLQHTAQTEAESPTDATGGTRPLVEKTVSYFKNLLASTLKLPVQQLRADEPMDQYGIDSVMVMELTGLLEQTFGPLSKTLFFEYQDIRSLSHYFVDAHAERLRALLEVESPGWRDCRRPDRTPLACPYKQPTSGQSPQRDAVSLSAAHPNNGPIPGRWTSPSSAWQDGIPVRGP